jgi:hypothetical protein
VSCAAGVGRIGHRVDAPGRGPQTSGTCRSMPSLRRGIAERDLRRRQRRAGERGNRQAISHCDRGVAAQFRGESGVGPSVGDSVGERSRKRCEEGPVLARAAYRARCRTGWSQKVTGSSLGNRGGSGTRRGHSRNVFLAAPPPSKKWRMKRETALPALGRRRAIAQVAINRCD